MLQTNLMHEVEGKRCGGMPCWVEQHALQRVGQSWPVTTIDGVLREHCCSVADTTHPWPAVEQEGREYFTACL